MAVNFESGNSLQTPSEADNLLPPKNEDTTTIPSFHCKLEYRVRKVQSKGAVLVLVWSILTLSCSTTVDTLIQSVVPFRFDVLDGVVTAALYLLAG